MQAEFEEANLGTIGNGSAGDLFQAELREVLRNIDDPNTKPDAVRVITLEVKIKPSEKRDSAAVQVNCKSKLAPTRPNVGFIYLGKSKGEMTATVSNIQQAHLFTNVTPIKAAAVAEGDEESSG
jgi:hypothetical protein